VLNVVLCNELKMFNVVQKSLSVDLVLYGKTGDGPGDGKLRVLKRH
jgi:hypothetical protein